MTSFSPVFSFIIVIFNYCLYGQRKDIRCSEIFSQPLLQQVKRGGREEEAHSYNFQISSAIGFSVSYHIKAIAKWDRGIVHPFYSGKFPNTVPYLG